MCEPTGVSCPENLTSDEKSTGAQGTLCNACFFDYIASKPRQGNNSVIKDAYMRHYRIIRSSQEERRIAGEGYRRSDEEMIR